MLCQHTTTLRRFLIQIFFELNKYINKITELNLLLFCIWLTIAPFSHTNGQAGLSTYTGALQSWGTQPGREDKTCPRVQASDHFPTSSDEAGWCLSPQSTVDACTMFSVGRKMFFCTHPNKVQKSCTSQNTKMYP